MERADRHNEIELNLLQQGSLTYLVGGRTVVIPARRLAVFWAAIPHQVVSSKDKSEYFVATIPLTWFLQCGFPAQFVDAILHARVVLDPEPRKGGGDVEVFERWVQDLESLDPIRRRIVFLEIEARLLRLALAVQAAEPADAAERSRETIIETGGLSRVEQMASYIAQHYTRKLTVEEIANAAGLHTNYAMGLFKKVLGITLIDCVTQHRVTHAQRLLATTDEKIICVGLESGFASLSRFQEAFKKWCGCSPKKYRTGHSVARLP